jgi:hypothetical protein
VATTGAVVAVKIKWTGKRTLITVALVVGVLWLYAMGSDKREQEGKDGAGSSSGSQCRVEATVDGLNIRSEPSTDADNVIGEMAKGQQADAEKTKENGFRKLSDDGWVSVRYAKAVGGDC